MNKRCECCHKLKEVIILSDLYNRIYYICYDCYYYDEDLDIEYYWSINEKI